MKTENIAIKVTIVAVEGECSCGGSLVAPNGSFSLAVHETGFKCQDCGKVHRLPKWVMVRAGKQVPA